jgi:hypothetical protein
VDPFVALMRKYCIDYTNSHDQSLYEQIMEPDYVVHINGMTLVRSTTYADAVKRIFDAAPGLGILVHEFVLNGDRLCMHFSEHAAMPAGAGRAPACWRGVGLYKWNGRRLTENNVEQDYFAMQSQIASGRPHPLLAPHIDPWTTTQPVPADPTAEATVRAWLENADLAATAAHDIDDGRTGAVYEAVLEPEDVPTFRSTSRSGARTEVAWVSRPNSMSANPPLFTSPGSLTSPMAASHPSRL